ncbi:hypothetical protein [Parasynechococcus sp.]|uniref:hypothetical protein n=1 Tax=Parasynechococcus sp. TaxID=3101203 RepID=UPI00370457E7
MSEDQPQRSTQDEIDALLRSLEEVIQESNSRKTVQNASREMSRLRELQNGRDLAA